LGIRYPAPQPVQDRRDQQRPYDPYSQQGRVDVYIYGPDEGARVSSGQSIYFDCEVTAPHNQYGQPRWSRAGNQPLPHKAQTTALQGHRKIQRLAIPDATYSDAGRYECSAGTGNPADQASIDLQVTEGGYYPRPQPQPQPQPHYPPYDPYNQYPYNQPGYHPSQPHPQPQPQPQPQPGDGEEGGDEGDEGEDAGADDKQEPAATTTVASKKTTTPAPQDEAAEDEGEYPEDYTENE